MTVAFVLAVALHQNVLPAATASVRHADSQSDRDMRTHDVLLLEVERRAPGFGGMFVDSDGTLAVYLLDLRQLPAARSAIESVFGPQTVPAAGAKAIAGQYTVSQLDAWKKKVRDILNTPGVTMVDLDEARNRLTVGVADSSRNRQVEKELAARRVPRNAVLIEVIGPITPVTR